MKSISEKIYFKQSNTTCFWSSDINFLIKQTQPPQKPPNKKTTAAPKIPENPHSIMVSLP